MGEFSLMQQSWTISLVFSSKRKIVLEWKHALFIAIRTTLLTNKWSTRSSLLWQEILMMVLSAPQSLNHETFRGLKITNLFIIWHGNCLLTGSNFSIKILLATVTFLLWIWLCYLLNMSSFCIGSISWCCFVVTLFHCSSHVPLFRGIPIVLPVFSCMFRQCFGVPPVSRCSVGVPCSVVSCSVVWRHNLVTKQLQYTYWPISHEVNTTRQWNLVN